MNSKLRQPSYLQYFCSASCFSYYLNFMF